MKYEKQLLCVCADEIILAHVFLPIFTRVSVCVCVCTLTATNYAVAR